MNSRRMPVICFVKGKLMPLDNTLPLIMELQRTGVVSSATLVFTNTDATALLREQPLLERALADSGISVVSMKGTQKGARLPFWSRSSNFLKQIRLSSRFLTGRILVIAFDMPRLLSLVQRLNRLMYSGRRLQNALLPMDAETLRHVSWVGSKYYCRPVYTVAVGRADAVLSNIDKDTLADFGQITGATDTPFVNIGYARGFDAWNEYVDLNLRVGLEDDIKKDFFFWPLSVLYREEQCGPKLNLVEPLAAVLRLLDKMRYPLQVVFRYHPTTDRHAFRHILSKTGFTNYTISFAHPHQLMRLARFTFSQCGTSLFSDAHQLGCPVVQYSPAPGFHCALGTDGMPIASLYQPVVDHFVTNEAEFQSVLLHFLGKPPTARRIRAACKLSREELSNRLSPYL